MITAPSAPVTMYGSPIGRQPCDTTETLCAPGRRTPTSPEVSTSRSRNSRVSPRRRPPLTTPPTTVVPGRSVLRCSMSRFDGNEYGSGSSRCKSCAVRSKRSQQVHGLVGV
ncbi:Uncharacterised protein [Mycobacterium tuberculosis]|uniref:Uncharacterized protein n=1 Tax=Mycobacterium tuberculosis TaxID=1773 RepID=A0A655JHH1_MYCTX|nr:Uncharacterised protein [Mycobacterium tuberculosis]